MLHAGPTLVSATLTCRFHITSMRKTVRSVTRQCITCRRQTTKPQSQMLGQLPLERVPPRAVFERVGVDYAGPFYIKHGMVVVKAYICVFVSLAVTAVHLEAVSNMTTEAFLATLRPFITRHGYPSLIWSDNGSNFIGASRLESGSNHGNAVGLSRMQPLSEKEPTLTSKEEGKNVVNLRN